MAACAMALLCAGTAAYGQDAARPQMAAIREEAQLPSAPTPALQTDGATQATGTISGTVTDAQGELVSGAKVTLTGDVVKAPRTTISAGDGTYFFEKVDAGTFHLEAAASGMNQGNIEGTIAAGAVYLAPPIRLGAATSSTELTVTPLTEREIATQEVKQEEKQRVLGIVPNYFVTYDKDPAPLDAKQKFSLGLHEVLDPVSFILAAGEAGGEQLVNYYPGFGSGPAAFGKRYGAAVADATSSTLFRDSIYPSLFHQDPRYYYLGEGTTWHRAKYALETALICKGDNGKWQTNYSSIVGSLSSGALSNLYYAPSDRKGVSLTLENSLIGIAGEGAAHLLQEFVLRRYTSHVPIGTPGP